MHSSVCGLLKNTYVRGAICFVTFVDDFLRNMWVYMMKSKGEWFERFEEF